MTDPAESLSAEQIVALVVSHGVDPGDGIAVAEHLAEAAGLSLDDLAELAAISLETRLDWPEDMGISSSDIAAHLEWMGEHDVVFLYEAIAQAATSSH